MKKFIAALIFLLILLAVLFMGFLAAVAPPGVVARFGVAVAGIFIIVLAWGFRQPDQGGERRWPVRFSQLVLILAFVWPPYVFFSVGGLPKLNPFTLTVSGGLLLLLASGIYLRDFMRHVAGMAREVKVALLIFAAWAVWRVVCNLASNNPLYTNISMVHEMVFSYSLFLYALFVCQGPDGIQRLSRLIVAATILVGLAGMMEAVEGKNRFIAFASNDENGDLGGILATITMEKIREGASRVQSVFSHPILFAQFLGAAAPIVGMSFLLDRSRLWRLLALFALPLILFGIYKAGSRSGVLALAVSGGILGAMFWVRLIVASKKYRTFAIFAIPVLLVSLGVLYGVAEQLVSGKSQIEHASTLVRLYQIHSAMHAIWTSPFIGFGEGASLNIAGVMTSVGALTMDVFYLEVLLQAGWPGMVLFVMLVLAIGVAAMREFVAATGRDRFYLPAYGAGACAVLATLFGVGTAPNIPFLLFCLAVVAASRYQRRLGAATVAAPRQAA